LSLFALSPSMTASYAVPVRRASALPAASFRFHLAMDTLAVQLAVPPIRPAGDLHPQVIAPCRAHQKRQGMSDHPLFSLGFTESIHSLHLGMLMMRRAPRNYKLRESPDDRRQASQNDCYAQHDVEHADVLIHAGFALQFASVGIDDIVSP
jgi:hypothetical protein